MIYVKVPKTSIVGKSTVVGAENRPYKGKKSTSSFLSYNATAKLRNLISDSIHHLSYLGKVRCIITENIG